MKADPVFLASEDAAEAYLSSDGWDVSALSLLATEVCLEPLPGRAIHAIERGKLLRAIERLEAAIPRLNQSWPVQARRLDPIAKWEFEGLRRLLAAQTDFTRAIEKAERQPLQRFAVKMLGKTLIAMGRLLSAEALAACAVLTNRLSEASVEDRVWLAANGVPGALTRAPSPVARPAKATKPKVRRRVVRNEAGHVLGVVTSATAMGQAALLKAWRRRHELALPHVERLLEQERGEVAERLERYEAAPDVVRGMVEQERHAQSRADLAAIDAARAVLRSAVAGARRKRA